MKINRNNPIYKAIHRYASMPPINPDASRIPAGIGRQTDINPVDPSKDVLPKLDDSPEAIEARTDAAKHSLLIPLAAILGVTAVLIIGVLIKMNA